VGLRIVSARNIFDGVLPETFDGMVAEIGGGVLVLRVLEAAHSTENGLALASSTWEEVAESALMVLNRDVVLEK
jgi:hypothetical protein